MIYYVYTDGSYKDFGSEIGAFYSSAAIVYPENDPDKVTALTKVSNDDSISMHNVIGEIVAAMMAFEHCLNVLHLKQDDTVRLCHDYVGLANWCKKKGEKDFWRCKNETSQAYRNYVNGIVRPRFKVEFIHTPGHSGNVGNDIVDKLAKDAMQQHVENLLAGGR